MPSATPAPIVAGEATTAGGGPTGTRTGTDAETGSGAGAAFGGLAGGRGSAGLADAAAGLAGDRTSAGVSVVALDGAGAATALSGFAAGGRSPASPSWCATTGGDGAASVGIGAEVGGAEGRSDGGAGASVEIGAGAGTGVALTGGGASGAGGGGSIAVSATGRSASTGGAGGAEAGLLGAGTDAAEGARFGSATARGRGGVSAAIRWVRVLRGGRERRGRLSSEPDTAPHGSAWKTSSTGGGTGNAAAVISKATTPVCRVSDARTEDGLTPAVRGRPRVAIEAPRQ